MRLAIFADIHSNLEAMQAFIEDAATRNIHRYMCLGDLIGYGANPNECIQLVRSLPKMSCILGNHDAAAIWRYSPYGMTQDATEVILWTIDRLSPDNADYLKQLQPVFVQVDMFFAHANPYNPEAYRYVTTRKYAARSFSSVKEKLTFIGHSHIPLVISRKNFFQISFEAPKGTKTYSISKEKKQIVNCGSIGQPRDGDPRACYCIVDTIKAQIEFHRVEYNYQITTEKIKSAGLPDILAKRLIKGK